MNRWSNHNSHPTPCGAGCDKEEVVEVRYNMTLWCGVGIGGSGCDEMGFPPSNELLEMSHVCHPCER